MSSTSRWSKARVSVLTSGLPRNCSCNRANVSRRSFDISGMFLSVFGSTLGAGGMCIEAVRRLADSSAMMAVHDCRPAAAHGEAAGKDTALQRGEQEPRTCLNRRDACRVQLDEACGDHAGHAAPSELGFAGDDTALDKASSSWPKTGRTPIIVPFGPPLDAALKPMLASCPEQALRVRLLRESRKQGMRHDPGTGCPRPAL